MTKLFKILFPITTVVLVFVCFILTHKVTETKSRQFKYYVIMQDELYERFDIPNLVNDNDFEIIKESSSSEITKISKKGIIPITAASISFEKSISLIENNNNSNQYRYELSVVDLLPSVKADFKNENSKQNSILSPDLSLSFTDVNEIPEGYRALPVDGEYAGSQNYPLRQREWVVCNVFVDAVRESLLEWCSETFGGDTEEKISSIEASIKSPVFIASVGDIMVARGVQEILMYDKNGLEKVFCDTLPILQNNDFTIGNLEGVVTDSWSNAIKTYTFKFNKKVLPFLKQAGFTYLMQTNNHCYDYGEEGFKDTLKALKEYDIPSSGIGYNIEEASQFYHTKIRDLNISVISCGAYPVERSGFNGKKTATATETRAGILWQSNELIEAVKEEKQAGYTVIVNVHGGEEYHFVPSKSQREFYENLCDAGADIVFGSHPHVLQPTEWYKDSLIVYSQGNFLFNGMEGMYRAEESEIVRVGILDGKIAYVEQYPAHLHETSVYLDKS